MNGQTAGTYVGIERNLPESDAVAAVFRNPAGDHVALRVPSGPSGSVNIRLFDRIGRRVLALEVSRPTSESEIVLDVGHLPPGVYLGRFVPSRGPGVSSFRFVKR